MQLFQSLKILSVLLEGDLCLSEALLPKELCSPLPLFLNMETERPKNHSFCHSRPAVMKVTGLSLQPRSTTSKNCLIELRTDSNKVLLRNPLIQ